MKASFLLFATVCVLLISGCVTPPAAESKIVYWRFDTEIRDYAKAQSESASAIDIGVKKLVEQNQLMLDKFDDLLARDEARSKAAADLAAQNAPPEVERLTVRAYQMAGTKCPPCDVLKDKARQLVFDLAWQDVDANTFRKFPHLEFEYGGRRFSVEDSDVDALNKWYRNILTTSNSAGRVVYSGNAVGQQGYTYSGYVYSQPLAQVCVGGVCYPSQQFAQQVSYSTPRRAVQYQVRWK